MTLPGNTDELARLTAGATMWSTATLPGADVPSVALADGPMGIASGRVDERDISVLTPCGVALGASWDPGLVARVGAVVGSAAKRHGVDLVLAPNLNLARSPLAGRAFELFSEEPWLAGTLGASWISGLQSRGVGAVAKHVVCNDSETGRDRYDALVDEPVLREVYLLPFELAADAGCAGLLMAYNGVNGHPCVEHRHLMTTVIKEEWRFPGMVVSDWFATKRTVPSAMAGLDLEMPGPGRQFGPALSRAVQDGAVPAARLMDAASRVARAARAWAGPDPDAAPEDRAVVLREAAAAGFTLLRNDGDLLPLGPEVRRIAVIGPNAALPCFQGGTFAKVSIRPDAPTPIEAIHARFPDREILFEPGVDPSPRLPSMPVRPARDLGDGCGRGMTVDYIEGGDDAAPPFLSETRDTNSLTWFAGMNEQARFDRPGIIRASGWFTPERTGDHHFVVGATGTFSLTVAGRTVLEREPLISPADIMGVLKAGDGTEVAVPLEAGVPVEVVVRLHFQPARAHGLWFGVRGPDDEAAMLARAVKAAAQADIVLLVLGETADSGVESKDRDTTKLADAQLALARAVCAANPNTAILVNVGHAFDPGFAEAARALMVTWYPGEEFGTALADVLAGEREPSGRLPVTLAARDADYPVLSLQPADDGTLPYAEGLLIGHRHLTGLGRAAAFPFGAGLGYGRPAIVRAVAAHGPDGGILVRASVTNSAERSGSAVIQAYDLDAPFALLGYAKVLVAPGATVDVELPIAAKALRHWTPDGWRKRSTPIRLGIAQSAGAIAVHLELAPEVPNHTDEAAR